MRPGDARRDAVVLVLFFDQAQRRSPVLGSKTRTADVHPLVGRDSECNGRSVGARSFSRDVPVPHSDSTTFIHGSHPIRNGWHCISWPPDQVRHAVAAVQLFEERQQRVVIVAYHSGGIARRSHPGRARSSVFRCAQPRREGLHSRHALVDAVARVKTAAARQENSIPGIEAKAWSITLSLSASPLPAAWPCS